MQVRNKFPFLIDSSWIISNVFKILLSKWKYSVYERHQIVFEMIDFSSNLTRKIRNVWISEFLNFRQPSWHILGGQQLGTDS